MKKVFLYKFLLLTVMTHLVGCSLTTLRGTDTPMAYQTTRLQYGILANDQNILKQDYKMQKTTGITERVVAGVALPFSAAVETVFLPFTYAFTTYLNEFYLDQPVSTNVQPVSK